MNSQRHLFDLPEDTHYLNCAYMSPLMKSVQEAGMAGIKRKANPSLIYPADYFAEAEVVRQKFGRLINSRPEQIALIPSASYGIKNAVNNIPAGKGTHAITVSDEFPSGYYSIAEWCKKNKKELKIVKAPETPAGRGKKWNEQLLESINKDTVAVVISSIHWGDGTIFNLKEIGKRCKEVNAVFIVDGTQSVGAMEIDAVACQIDALVCAAYKWLMSPYSIGLAYYSDYFNNGTPLEDVWLNKPRSEDFANLTNYTDDYKPGASRFNAGEYSNFILMPMMDRALDQVLAWGTTAIQEYCCQLTEPLIHVLKGKGYWVEEDSFRPHHLFGFVSPDTVDKNGLLQRLRDNKVFISLRSGAFRISPHVYNTENDIARVIEAINKL